jgi:hypothetical protein
MSVVNAAQAATKSVGDPCAAYETIRPLWLMSRAACSGERYVKDLDYMVDTMSFTNLLIPFSPSMTQEQFNFYKAEAEWPGITSQFAKMLVGGLLRKPPQLTLPKSVPEGGKEWILNEFGRDDSSLVSFLDGALKEEVEAKSWIFVDYPKIEGDPSMLDKEELAKYKPYPVLHCAENIVNWRLSTNKYGKTILDLVVVAGLRESYDENEFHPTFKDTRTVHDLDEAGNYRVRVYVKSSNESDVPVISGETRQKIKSENAHFDLEDTIYPLVNDENLDYIPGWPLNGIYDLLEPMLMAIIDKEKSLYNKLSRRNHLLYGAATYTPVVSSDMSDEQFDAVVNSGLGSWIHLRQGDEAKVLETPTAALQDMEKAIAASIEEMAKLGIRMLSPESAADQSGIALEIRNAAQTAQLGALNTRVSETMRQVICFMLNWRYELTLKPSDIEFSLSSDFNPAPLGADWLRLATEWYQQGLIPRSVWVVLLKVNDMIPPDYNDEEGKKEINADEIVQGGQVQKDNQNFAVNLDKQKQSIDHADQAMKLQEQQAKQGN